VRLQPRPDAVSQVAADRGVEQDPDVISASRELYEGGHADLLNCIGYREHRFARNPPPPPVRVVAVYVHVSRYEATRVFRRRCVQTNDTLSSEVALKVASFKVRGSVGLPY